MKRAARLPSLPLRLDATRMMPLWEQLSIELRVAIASGRLGPGARLPSTRQLARELGVSRNTVAAAYEDLAARDLLKGHTGRGSFVAGPSLAFPLAKAWFQDPSGNALAIGSLPT